MVEKRVKKFGQGPPPPPFRAMKSICYVTSSLRRHYFNWNAPYSKPTIPHASYSPFKIHLHLLLHLQMTKLFTMNAAKVPMHGLASSIHPAPPTLIYSKLMFSVCVDLCNKWETGTLIYWPHFVSMKFHAKINA